MPLSAQDISDRLWDGAAAPEPDRTICVVPLLDKKEVEKRNAASIDLRLGRWFRATRHTRLAELKLDDDRAEAQISREHYIRFDNDFVLHPGQFVLGITLEWLRIPTDLVGYVTGRSSWGRRGLVIETATGIHPGFIGCLTLELANVGTIPVRLRPGMQVCQLFLHHVKNNARGTTTQFVGYRKPGLGSVRADPVAASLQKQYFEGEAAT